MKSRNFTYLGPAIDDEEILLLIPEELIALLRNTNGFILNRGVLHVRGACKNPGWHSLRNIMQGSNALFRLFPKVQESDIPFGQDCMGDQFLLRNDQVHRLMSETGEIQGLEFSLQQFMKIAEEEPYKILSPEPLYKFEMQGHILQPGQLLNAFPPFCIKTSTEEVSLKAIPMEEQISFLAALAKQIKNVPDRTKARLSITD